MSNHDPYSDSPEPVGWIQHHQLYSSVGANIVMESITLSDHPGGFECYGLLATVDLRLARHPEELITSCRSICHDKSDAVFAWIYFRLTTCRYYFPDGGTGLLPACRQYIRTKKKL